MSRPTNATLDYAPPFRRRRLQTAGWVAGLLLLAFISSPFLANAYTSSRYQGLKPGMTRAQVERQLCGFISFANTTYNGAGKGQFVIRYEFLWFGKMAAIQVIYNANGTVVDPQPIFNN